MSTPGAVRIYDKRIGKSLYLYTRYDGQLEEPHGLGAFLKGFLPCIIKHFGDDVSAADIANTLLGLSQEYRKEEELEIFLPENDERWGWGDYNYLITIETKKFKSFEYPVITLVTEVDDEEDDYESHLTTLYQWEGGDE